MQKTLKNKIMTNLKELKDFFDQIGESTILEFKIDMWSNTITILLEDSKKIHTSLVLEHVRGYCYASSDKSRQMERAERLELTSIFTVDSQASVLVKDKTVLGEEFNHEFIPNLGMEIWNDLLYVQTKFISIADRKFSLPD